MWKHVSGCHAGDFGGLSLSVLVLVGTHTRLARTDWDESGGAPLLGRVYAGPCRWGVLLVEAGGVGCQRKSVTAGDLFARSRGVWFG
jgi:hypothetical protein